MFLVFSLYFFYGLLLYLQFTTHWKPFIAGLPIGAVEFFNFYSHYYTSLEVPSMATSVRTVRTLLRYTRLTPPLTNTPHSLSSLIHRTLSVTPLRYTLTRYEAPTLSTCSSKSFNVNNRFYKRGRSFLRSVQVQVEPSRVDHAVSAIELALDSVVKIFTVSCSPNYLLPWQNKSQRETMGSG